ncbi:MAG: sigma 54-interacting transcriptional regulator [Pirellulales bacterium]
MFYPVGCEFEKVAAFIHHSSDRAGQPFARQRCVHWQDSMDPVRTVGAGTLFVEGIQHASLPAGLRLLAEMDEARLSRQQTDGAMPVPPRIIASANEDLFSLVENGMLLEDLHWQLCALSLRVPGLAERSEDIPSIAQQMLDRAELMQGDSPSFGH